MSIFVSPTKAITPKTKNIIPISLMFAALLTLLALLQLFRFEDFSSHLTTIGLPLPIALFLAPFIVILEVLALPFALRLSLSSAFRALSMGCGWLVAIVLLYIAIFENIFAATKYDAVFGATLPLPVGAWSICTALALLVLAAWTSWGLFPFRAKK